MNNYLYHHGIMGQKWGVRRYQNPDGSLTAVGRKRYAKELVREYKKGYKYSYPSKTSKKFKSLVKDEVKKVVTDQDRENLKNLSNKSESAYQKYLRVYEEGEEWRKKTGEGYEAYLPDPMQDKLYKYEDEYNKAHLEYTKYVKDIGRRLVGEYADVKVHKGINGKRPTTLNDAIYWSMPVDEIINGKK